MSAWISPRPISWNPSSQLFYFLFFRIYNLFRDFRDWLCHKSYEVMHNIWTQFSLFQAWWVSQLSLQKRYHLQWCNPSRHSWWSFCQGSLLLTIDNPLHRVPDNPLHGVLDIMILPGSYDLEAELEILCFMATRPIQHLRGEFVRFWVARSIVQ